jgi:serine phosphatase RsbU (regulator of sigma subunit)
MQLDAHDGRSHITSLDPVNPENVPDIWERKALQAFERGEKEISSVEQMAGETYVRLMHPLVVDDTCLKCHGRQGYQVGDIRGGISVSVPTAPMWASAKTHMLTLSVGHGFLWLLGLGGIGLGMRDLRRQAKDRYRAEEKLRENEIRMRTLTEHNARVKAEQTLLATEDKLLMARRIQESFLPDSAPAVDGFDIGGLSCPAESTSGDYYDYLPMRDGRIGIVIADVSGHGIGPALFAAETSAYLRASAEVSGDVGEILTRLNAFLSANERNDRFVTLFLACLNPQDRSLVYASAGHQCYLFNGTQGATALDATGIPLGVMPGTVYPSSGPLTLEPGDSVLFVTDGILETSSHNGHSFGVGRVLDLVQANRDKPAREIVDLLYSTARKFSDDRPQLDDMTAVILKTGFARP